MGTYSPAPPPGLRQAIVDYVGDGSNDRVITVGFRSKFYAIFRRIDGVRTFEDLLAFDSASWTLFLDGGYPLKYNESVVTSSGINVGRVFWLQGGGNDSGVNFRVIAFA